MAPPLAGGLIRALINRGSDQSLNYQTRLFQTATLSGPFQFASIRGECAEWRPRQERIQQQRRLSKNDLNEAKRLNDLNTIICFL